jgi:iron(II)-dependent oxidoreductase|tara:strand:+ start:589 stop:1425 length:837 start_codon:yes stop_codon:yes gene_type:complete
MRVFTTFTISFFYLFTSIVFANLSDLNPYKGMALIHEGIYPMGSYKSLKELRPGDLFNTDRHALGPENPAHNVYIDSFYIDIFEVTNSSYMEFSKATESRKPLFWKNPDFNQHKQPVVGITWKEAQSYCKWRGGRLPTEAEWEKASRGKRPISYPWGNEVPDNSKINFNHILNKTAPVGSYDKGISDYGIHDLSGNVSEWTYDWHLPEYYIFSTKMNPTGPKKGIYKVIRGGNWRNKTADVNMTYRNATVPSIRNKTLGFRCAKGSNPITSRKYSIPK